MANFIGKVRMPGEYVFQNKKADGLTTISDPGPQIYEGDIYIPDLSTVDLSQFQKVYTYADTNQERPYYVFQYVRENLDAGRPAQKVNFAPGTKITFFYNDRLNNTIGTGNVTNATGYQEIDNPIDLDMYSYGYPLSGTGSSSSIINAMYDFSCSSTSGSGGGVRCDLLAKTAIDADIQGFNASYNQDLDAFLIPGTKRTVNNFANKGYYFYDSNNNVSMYNEDGIQSYSRNVLLGDTRKYFNRLFKNNSSLRIINDSNAQYVLKMPYLKKDSYSYLYYGISTSRGYGTYGLLRDSNTGEYWIMCVGTDTFGGYDNYVVLTQFRNCYISLGSASNVNGTINQVMRYVDESTFGNLDDFLTDLFSIQKEPSYEDEAPEAVGPGDPYDDDKLSNAGGIVGGNTNINIEIDNVDTTPNLGYDDFVRSYGLFGTYNLTPDNLLNYTRTLTLLYENSVLPAQETGDKARLMAELIKENTVSVNFLPFSIPDEECELVSFDIGTKTIRKATKFGQFMLPEYDDKAKLIKQITGVYNIPIGTIPHYYDNFLDFAPYSSASLYIPYIGKVELPINLIQSTSENVRNLSLSFRIDRCDGDMVVILSSNNVPLCHWSGNCAKSLKLSIQDNGDLQKAQLKRTVGAIESIAMGGYAAATGNAFIGLQAGLNMTSVLQPGNISTAQHMIGNSPQVGDLGWMDMQKIVLTVERPIWWKPYDYGSLVGYPTKKIVKLSSLSGFSMIPEAHIKCNLNTEEINELQELLSKGVIF